MVRIAIKTLSDTVDGTNATYAHYNNITDERACSLFLSSLLSFQFLVLLVFTIDKNASSQISSGSS